MLVGIVACLVVVAAAAVALVGFVAWLIEVVAAASVVLL